MKTGRPTKATPQLIELLSSGMSCAEAARKFGIHRNTAVNYKRKILDSKRTVNTPIKMLVKTGSINQEVEATEFYEAVVKALRVSPPGHTGRDVCFRQSIRPEDPLGPY